MSRNDHDPGRRRLLGYVAVGATALPFTALVSFTRHAKADLPRLDEASDQAQRLDYVHEADAEDLAGRSNGEYCHNCRYFSNEQDGWGECPIFRGSLVSASGWCSAWDAV